MTLLRFGLLSAAALLALSGCETGAPDRASDIQNLNGISDDISARTMTDSANRETHDPNFETTLPNNYQTAGDER